MPDTLLSAKKYSCAALESTAQGWGRGDRKVTSHNPVPYKNSGNKPGLRKLTKSEDIKEGSPEESTLKLSLENESRSIT